MISSNLSSVLLTYTLFLPLAWLYKRGCSAPCSLPFPFATILSPLLTLNPCDRGLRNKNMAGSGSGSGSSSSPPCASCKLLRRRCTQECVFAPYFPPEDPHKFAIVHKVFGASNVSKMLQVRSILLLLDLVHSVFSSPSLLSSMDHSASLLIRLT